MASKRMTLGLKYCYCTRLGKPARSIMTRPFITALGGLYMDSALSVKRIEGFVRSNNIDMNEYAQRSYRSFNDFFTRSIKPVGGSSIAGEYLNGTCLVLRLGVENYHRYCYIDDGFKSGNHRIPGRYHPVQPIVVRKQPVFVQNTREYTVLNTKNFGTVTQIEVGACLVGRICNHHEACIIHRGEEKGFFEFGGSTIVLLFKEGTVDIPQEVFDATLSDKEAIVKYGSAIGRKAGC